MLNDLLSLLSVYQLKWTWPTVTPETVAALVLLVAFGVFAAMEKYAPKNKVSNQLLRQSYNTNLGLFVFNSVVMALLSASMLWMVAKQHLGQGLLFWITNPVWKVVLSFLALDLLLYVWHRVCHRFDGLWMFHKVHHNDPYLNVSTGFRVHIIELFTTYVLKAVLIITMGIDELIVLVNEVLTTVFIMFHHTNRAFKGEKWLGYVFTTPSLHQTHHSVERSEHDSNYGAMLSVWDRLFGTLLEKEPVEIGIRGYSPQDFTGLIKFGFVQKQSPVPMPAELDVMIAEAAYYKAEKRNFKPGHEWDDWLEAKKDIMKSVYGNKNRKLQMDKASRHDAENGLDKLLCNLGFCNGRHQKYS